MEKVKITFPGIIGVIPFHIYTKYTKDQINGSSISPFNIKLFIEKTFTEKYQYLSFGVLDQSPLDILDFLLKLVGIKKENNQIGKIIKLSEQFQLSEQFNQNIILSIFLVEIKEIDESHTHGKLCWRDNIFFIKNANDLDKINNNLNIVLNPGIKLDFKPVQQSALEPPSPWESLVDLQKIINALGKNDLLFI